MNTTKVLLRPASGLTYLHKINEANSELSVSLVPIEPSHTHFSYAPMKLELLIDSSAPGIEIVLHANGSYEVFTRATL